MEVGGVVRNVEKMTPPSFLGSKIMNLLVFFVFEPKNFSGFRLHGVCMGRSGTSAYAVYAIFRHFWCVESFGNLGDPMVPTLRGMSGYVVTVYAS